MSNDGRMCCPDCLSHNAVAKWAAWDASAQIPPKVMEELDRLHAVEIAARALLAASPHPGSENVVVTTVPLALLEGLADVTLPTPPEDTQ